MSLQLPHKTLDLYLLAKKILNCCYEITQDLSPEVRRTLAQEMRKASLTAYQKIIIGLVQEKKKKRRQYFQSALDSLVLIDAIMEVLLDMDHITGKTANELTEMIQTAYMIIEGRIENKNGEWDKRKK
jgi:hypothetical protein